jgi:ligand-binding sensor domain-containing protein
MKKSPIPAIVWTLVICAAAFLIAFRMPWLVRGAPRDLAASLYTEWKTFLPKDGLPHRWVLSVRVAGDQVWCGTEDGCAVLDTKTGRITSYGVKDGLPFPAVLMIDFDRYGNVWLATAGGAARFDGKKFTSFKRESSGLVNNVVYGVCCLDDDVFFATTDGIGRYNQKTGEWKKYRLDNAPLEEVWCYGISQGDGRVWTAAWGGGLVEYDPRTDRWQAYHDPDGVFDIDLIRNDGVISQMTIGTSHDGDLTWVGTYFGLSVYDERRWRDWDEDHGLPTNFLNAVRARGKTGWACTDKGLCSVDLDASRTVTYQRKDTAIGAMGIITIRDFDGAVLGRYPARGAIPDNFVWQADFQGDDIWIATSNGLGRGRKGGAR